MIDWGVVICWVLGIGIFLFLGVLFYSEVTAEKFYLRKDQWKCTASHQETYTTMMQVGSMQIPQFHTTTVCDKWERIK